MISTSGNIIPFERGSGSVDAKAAPANPLVARLAAEHFDELTWRFDAGQRALWVYQDKLVRLRYTPELLRDIGRMQAIVAATMQDLDRGGDEVLRYVVWASSAPNSFNLGGDLPLLAELVARQDRVGLREYAELCIDVVRGNAMAMGAPVITISLVQGDALGGGLEAALSSDIVIAEARSRFGLPEILFGLFPGMGAFNFLAARCGIREAQRMVTSGRIYSAQDMLAMGLVDTVGPDGRGEETVRENIAVLDRKFIAHRSIHQIRRQFCRFDDKDFRSIAEIWVEAALRLEESDLKKMRRLSSAQIRRRTDAVGKDEAGRASGNDPRRP